MLAGNAARPRTAIVWAWPMRGVHASDYRYLSRPPHLTMGMCRLSRRRSYRATSISGAFLSIFSTGAATQSVDISSVMRSYESALFAARL
jgi:hypothetical protein